MPRKASTVNQWSRCARALRCKRAEASGTIAVVAGATRGAWAWNRAGTCGSRCESLLHRAQLARQPVTVQSA